MLAKSPFADNVSAKGFTQAQFWA